MSEIPTWLGGGVLGAAELQKRLGVSPATLMRRVRASRPDVIPIGSGRARRYGLRQVWPNLDNSRFPVFRILEDGNPCSAGELVTLTARQTVWLPGGIVSAGLPLEIADARPAGFLGRHFAAAHADLRLPARLDEWSDHHILLAMARRGEDLPGNLILGEDSFARWQMLDPQETARNNYPDIAQATIAGHPPGSSAGGERPKFGAFVDGRHVLVKFAPRGVGHDANASTRWCDLLVLEALALEVVPRHGIIAAPTMLVEADAYYFLESVRFDRAGMRGRISVLSLAAVQDDLADPWARAATLLRDSRRLSVEDARRICWLDAFGALTGNTDRHPYNVLFFNEGPMLRLAPTFDQVAMLYAPASNGQIPARTFSPPPIMAETLEVWDSARTAAREFWLRTSDDHRVSEGFRAIAAANAEKLRS
jgi:hypothetical protein